MPRVVIGFVVLVALALGALVAVDRYALAQTERRVVEDLAEAGIELSPDVDVDIAGFPFLTQVARGRITVATLEADRAVIDGYELTDVEVAARGITTAAPSAVESLEVVATAPVTTLTEAVADSPLAERGFDVEVGIEAGLVVASTSVFGLPVEVTLRPEPAGREIAMALAGFAVAGFAVDADALPAALREGLGAISVPLEGLPEGMTLTAVETVPDGLRITAQGANLPLEDLARAR